jgi:RNA polymerase sigma factor (sigma-70 family)
MPGTAQKEATAEILALLAQQGDREAAGLLWEKVYKLYYMKAAKIYQKRREQFIRCGVELEDIQQECFLAFQASLRAFDPARGYKFTAWLSYPLQNRINVLMHCRGSMKPEPLDSADSLEKPIPGTEEDLTIGDTLEDPEAGEMLRDAEDRVFTEELHNALIECLATLPEAQRAAIEGRHFELGILGITAGGAAAGAGVGAWILHLGTVGTLLSAAIPAIALYKNRRRCRHRKK